MLLWGECSDSRGQDSAQGQRGLGAHGQGQGLGALLLRVPGPRCWPHCPSPSAGSPALARGLAWTGWGGAREDRDEACAWRPPGLTTASPPRRAQDTLRDCTHDERSCLSSLQFVSPLYFVSFVLTAQFVLINVVVAVLMKHLDDSNKEAQEDAEMDAELELEMAHSLGPGPRPPAGSPGAHVPGRRPGGAGSAGDAEGRLIRNCYSPAQVGGAWRGQRGRRGPGGQLGRGPRAESSVVSGPTRSAPLMGRPCDEGSGPGHGQRTRRAAVPTHPAVPTRPIIPPVPTPPRPPRRTCGWTASL